MAARRRSGVRRIRQTRSRLAYVVRTMAAMNAAKAERLHLRVEPEQKALLEAASAASGSTVSAFVLKVATEAAADILADRRAFVLDETVWQDFDHALERPATEVSGLRELLNTPTVLDEPDPGLDER
jgi:uncharacterized protein (DUF1778 family)